MQDTRTATWRWKRAGMPGWGLWLLLKAVLLKMWSLDQQHGQQSTTWELTRNTNSQYRPRPTQWDTLGRGPSELWGRLLFETLCSQVLGDPAAVLSKRVLWSKILLKQIALVVVCWAGWNEKADTCLQERGPAQSYKCRRSGGWGRSDGRGTGTGKALGLGNWWGLWSLPHSIPSKDK